MDKPSQEIKFSKYQVLYSVIIPIAFYEPIAHMVRQGMYFHQYWFWWFLLAIFAFGYFCWNVIRVTILMLMGKPAIVLSNKGITCSQKGYLIEWKDITEMNLEVTGGKGRSYNIVIEVKDPWKYISQVRNPLVRNFCWFAKDYSYRPFTINLNNVEGDNYEVYDEVKQYYRTYK